MNHNDPDGSNADGEAMQLVLFNTVRALLCTHPQPERLREVLEEMADHQMDVLLEGDASTELTDACEHFHEIMLMAIPQVDGPIDMDMDLTLKFK